jgi:hypothetical protein
MVPVDGSSRGSNCVFVFAQVANKPFHQLSNSYLFCVSCATFSQVRKEIRLSVSIAPGLPDAAEEAYAVATDTDCESECSSTSAEPMEFQWVDSKYAVAGSSGGVSFTQFVVSHLDERGRVEFLRLLYFNGDHVDHRHSS